MKELPSIKLVLSDYDATLALPGAAQVSRYAYEGICALLDAGVLFGPVTGRTPAYMGSSFFNDSRCCQTGLFVNGQVLMVDGEIVRTMELPRAGVEKLFEIVDTFDDAVLTCGIIEDEVSVFVTKDSAKAEHHLNDSPWYGGSMSELPSRPLVKVGIHLSASMERVRELKEYLAKNVPELSFVLPGPMLPYVDVVNHGWGKGRAVEALAEYLGLGLDEVVVFGDSENDLSMMRTVPNSVAVANALPEVAQAARFHIASCYDDAVANALFDIARAAKEGQVPAFMQRG